MSNKTKRVSKKKRWCSVHGEFTGYQWGGHRRTCKELEAAGPPKKTGDTRAMKHPETPRTTAADQVVKTVRSYLAAIDEESARNDAAIKELTDRMSVIMKRQSEIKDERAKIVSSLKDLK